MNKVIVSTKKFVRKHKEALVVGGVLATVAYLQYQGIKSLNNFLVEHNLFETYYLTETEV